MRKRRSSIAPIPAVLVIALSLLAPPSGFGGSDADGDGVPDASDNCPFDPNCAPGLTEIQLLVASDAGADQDFGFSVSLSADGRTALVGAPFSPAAYVFTFDGGTWIEQQILTASAPGRLGYSVSLSSDGSMALVGAPSSESAYVYTRSGSVWTEQQRLFASDGGNADYFGTAVALSQDGTTALVGAFQMGSSGGAAYVFTRNGDVWTQQQKLTASDAGGGDRFGSSVALSANGATALVSAPWNSLERGAAYMFVRSGGVWTQRQKLTASDAFVGDQFGWSVALSDNGTTALLGAPFNDDSGTESGSAYVFTDAGLGWAERKKLVASNGASFDRLGYSVSLSSDAATAIVGAYWTAYVYKWDAGVWSEDQELEPDGVTSPDLFGSSVSVSSDGARVLVGAYNDQTPDVRTGSAWVFFSACQLDRDEDGFGDACDCEPTDPSSFPGAAERCDAIDNDCNGVIDDGFGGDSCDGVGECGAGVTECDSAGELRCSTNPGGSDDQSAPELCDGLDNDCDGDTDESDALDQTVWYGDADGDGFGDPGSPALACDAPPGFVADNTDNCPDTFNPFQADGDGDGIGDLCDNCAGTPNCDPDWVETKKIVADGTSPGAQFGNRVAISEDGSIALVKGGGAVYVLYRNGGLWTEQQVLTPEEGVTIALSADGTTALVGAPYLDSPQVQAGAVYVFTLDGGVWVETQRLTASDAAAFDRFGNSVSLSADGSTALIGAYWVDDVYEDSGAAYVFELDGGSWTERQKLQASDGLGFDLFGRAVALSADGARAVILATGDYPGSIYAWRLEGESWVEWQKVPASYPQGCAYPKGSLAFSADGTTALVGAPCGEGSDQHWLPGHAILFSESAGMWTQETMFSGGSFDEFGTSVALSGDGGLAYVGAPSNTIGGGPGDVRVFRRDDGGWSSGQTLEPSDGEMEDHFGYSLAASDDGTVVLVGAPWEEDDPAFYGGAVYAFEETCLHTDTDADGAGDACDCSPGEPQLWATPGAVSSVSFGPGTTMINWSAPSSPGGLPWTVRYDTIRSSEAPDFVTDAVCVETNDGSDQQADATGDPALGEVYFYLVRPENDCGEGPLGNSTSGPRPPALSCEL